MRAALPRSINLPSLDKLILEQVIPLESIPTFAVLCINCEEFIEGEAVDRHSVLCIRQSKAITDREDRGDLDLNQLRLERLKEFVSKLTAKERQPSQRSFLSVIVRTCEDIAGMKDGTQVKAMLKYQDSLKQSASRLQNTEVQLVADRLIALIEQRKLALLSKESLQKSEELLQLKSEVLYYHELSTKLLSQRPADLILAKVNSEVNSKASSRSSYSSEMTEMRESLQSLNDVPTPCDSSESFKRLFYSFCLATKLGFPKNHPAHKVAISKMYRLALGKGVPMDAWKEFIADYFSSLASTQIRAAERKAVMIRTITEDDEIENSFSVDS
jgi:hypothetical protein